MAGKSKKPVQAKYEDEKAQDKEKLNFIATKADADNYRAIAAMEEKTFSELCNTLLQRHVELNKDLLEEYRALKTRVKRIE